MNLQNAKVLITGADGFIGSHLTEELMGKCAHLRVLTLYNSFNNHGWLDNLPSEQKENIEIISGDIRDQEFIRNSLKDIDVVLHLAALIAIPFSYKAPESYVDTNVRGTLNILNAALHHNVKKILITSTSEVYGTANYVPIDEKHPLQPQSPYSATKIAADNLAKSFYYSFDLPVTVIRPFNTYGPRQSARAIIPTVISQLLAGETQLKLGDLSPTRDFNYVKDIVHGFINVAQSENTHGEEINIATGIETSIAEVTQYLIDLINPEAQIIQDSSRLRPAKSEVFRLLGCNKKIQSLTKWKPMYNIKQGLAETIEWFKENNHLYKHGIYNI